MDWKLNLPDYWKEEPKYDGYDKALDKVKKGEKKYKEKYGIDKFYAMSIRVAKKMLKHNEKPEGLAEQVEREKVKNLSWKKQKEFIKKRFPYLTDEEVEFLGIGSGMKG